MLDIGHLFVHFALRETQGITAGYQPDQMLRGAGVRFLKLRGGSALLNNQVFYVNTYFRQMI
ncbi:MAG: hypothetical protein ACYDCW_12875 [Acidithiobacillus ferrivorans]